jgi:imidazolonepropionase
MLKIFANAKQIVTCAGPAPRRGAEMNMLDIRTDAAIVIDDGRIVSVGNQRDLEPKFPGAIYVDCANHILTPGLIDSHTHAVFGKARYEEQELRASGLGYMEIAQQGGGIHSSVSDFRERDEDELYTLARLRLEKLASYGTTTVEIKSGYGLNLEQELKALRVIKRLQHDLKLRIIPTWLGAHEIPLDYRNAIGMREAYIRLLIQEMIPAVVEQQLATFADVFCEPGVFTPEETRTILTAAKEAGLALKIHADELEPSGGAELAAELGATSADHLAAISDEGITKLAESNTVATLLPGTMFFLGREKQAPARKLIDAGAAVALATDFNPGTSPTVNFPLILTLGVSQLRMGVAEVLHAATVNAAVALNLGEETGQLAPGYSADIAMWDCDDVRELPYWYGDRRCVATWVRGELVHGV